MLTHDFVCAEKMNLRVLLLNSGRSAFVFFKDTGEI